MLDAQQTPSQPLSPRQSQIVDAAFRLIATEGPRRFTVGLLAKEVGLTGGAIYRHFDSMDAIVDAVVDRVGRLLFENFPPQVDDPIRRLQLFFYCRARSILGNPYLSRLLLSDHLLQAGRASQSQRLNEFKRQSHSFVIGCLREAQHNGSLVDEMSPEAGAVVILGSVLALSHTTAKLTQESERERLFHQVWSGIERMLRRSELAMNSMHRRRPSVGK
jgi:AcrR family transcriptional regulator